MSWATHQTGSATTSAGSTPTVLSGDAEWSVERQALSAAMSCASMSCRSGCDKRLKPTEVARIEEWTGLVEDSSQPRNTTRRQPGAGFDAAEWSRTITLKPAVSGADWRTTGARSQRISRTLAFDLGFRPFAIGCKHRDPEALCEHQTGSIRKGETLGFGGRSQARDFDAVVVSDRFDRDDLADKLGASHLRCRDTWVLAALRELRQASAQFATLIAAPPLIASRTADAPSSSFRWASSADASRTAAGASASTSATAATLGLVGLLLGAHFCAPVCDQLVGQADARRQVREHAARPLYCGDAPLSGGFLSFRRLGHVCP
jgi:hypothetical protein